MSKYQVIFYSSDSRYSYFVKVPYMNDIDDESYKAVHEAFDKHISKLGIQIDEINCRKVR